MSSRRTVNVEKSRSTAITLVAMSLGFAVVQLESRS